MGTKQFIKGLHHVTATVNDAQEDYDFYTNILGLRLVKKTVNFDNNKVYHFYYGNEAGTPGTIMTTFPYKGQNVRDGVQGTGQVSITAFSFPIQGIDFWRNRLAQFGIAYTEKEKFDLPVLEFKDPSGLILELVGNDEDERAAWISEGFSKENAIQGFFNVTLSIQEVQSTFDFLSNEFGFEKIATEGKLTRFAVNGGGPGQYVDIRDDKEVVRGQNGIGTVHHVAWRIENDENLLEMRRHLVEDLGFKVTDVKDRNYFHSIYFRMPGHVLFEIATIPPGFGIDETPEELGQDLKLPEWEEKNRVSIEQHLPRITS